MNGLFDISGKTVVMTGATGVLGSCISRYLAQEGAIMIVIGRNCERGKKLEEEITQAGGTAWFIQCDVLDRPSLEQCREEIIKRLGRINVLINAAGGNMPGATIPTDKTFFDMSMEDFKKVVDLNLLGTVLPTQVFAEDMAKHKNGAIVNFSSESALRPLTRVVGYTSAKAAVQQFTRYMAVEMATKFGNGIRVNAIAPGFFLTEQNRTLLTNSDGSLTARGKAIIAHTPFGRFGTPDELCGTIHYLISDASRFVSGTVAVVDGAFDSFCL
ncbi:MAG: SDR family oxidoreductase [Porphyromonadaceae bacterium]|nr:SDR family oxidoreductase [Porphyromonadaceae bacterium]